jgi:hypothetical protein
LRFGDFLLAFKPQIGKNTIVVEGQWWQGDVFFALQNTDLVESTLAEVRMREKLVAQKLWDADDPTDPAGSVEAAWRVLARTGAACRYIGVTPDGQQEMLLVDPRSGGLLASGCGPSTAAAICQAALSASRLGRCPDLH